MRTYNSKSTPRVKGGRVQKKNNWTASRDYYVILQTLPVVDRKRPGRGYRHMLTQHDVHTFIGLLPDWVELSRGLNAVVLAPGEWEIAGYHVAGVVHVCAWERELWTETTAAAVVEHHDILARLEVECCVKKGYFVCKWTEPQIRAYQLLHILLHELGHHHDRITTQSQVRASRGEPYAEMYARRYMDRIWDRYVETFGLD